MAVNVLKSPRSQTPNPPPATGHPAHSYARKKRLQLADVSDRSAIYPTVRGAGFPQNLGPVNSSPWPPSFFPVLPTLSANSLRLRLRIDPRQHQRPVALGASTPGRSQIIIAPIGVCRRQTAPRLADIHANPRKVRNIARAGTWRRALLIAEIVRKSRNPFVRIVWKLGQQRFVNAAPLVTSIPDEFLVRYTATRSSSPHDPRGLE